MQKRRHCLLLVCLFVFVCFFVFCFFCFLFVCLFTEGGIKNGLKYSCPKPHCTHVLVACLIISMSANKFLSIDLNNVAKKVSLKHKNIYDALNKVLNPHYIIGFYNYVLTGFLQKIQRETKVPRGCSYSIINCFIFSNCLCSSHKLCTFVLICSEFDAKRYPGS